MHTLIYHSISQNECSDDELELFLTTIRKKNITLDVTGILLYHDGQIIQILEGEKDTIINLFEEIKIDKRHFGVVELINFKMEDRACRDWSMAFKKASKKDWLKIEGYLNFNSNIQQNILMEQTKNRTYLKMLIDSFVDLNLN